MQCPTCNKELKNANGLRLHMAAHERASAPASVIPETTPVAPEANNDVHKSAVVPETPEVSPKPDLEAKLDATNARLDKLVDVVSSVVDMVKTKETAPEVKKPEPKVAAPEDSFTTQAPKAWKLIVDKFLGPDFDLKVEDTVHGDYIAYFVLPPHLDRRHGEDKNNGSSRDVSTGIIRRSTALADIEKWSKLIRDNIKKVHRDFNPAN